MDDKTKGLLVIGGIAAAGLVLLGGKGNVIVPLPPDPDPLPTPAVMTSAKTGMKWSIAVSQTNPNQYILTVISIGSLIAATDSITPLFVAFAGPNLTGSVLAVKDVGHDQTSVKVGAMVITPPKIPGAQSGAIRLDIRRRGFTDAGHNSPGVIAVPLNPPSVPGTFDAGLISLVPLIA